MWLSAEDRKSLSEVINLGSSGCGDSGGVGNGYQSSLEKLKQF